MTRLVAWDNAMSPAMTATGVRQRGTRLFYQSVG